MAGAHLGIADGFRLAEPEAEAILDLAASAWDPQSDGLIAACLNCRSHLVIDALEARIGKPVVTSTQRVLWRLLRLAGIKRRSTDSASFASALARAAQGPEWRKRSDRSLSPIQSLVVQLTTLLTSRCSGSVA
jgi:hypothetical protein